MNSKYKNCPEIIAEVREVTSDGDEKHFGDKVLGIQVRVSEGVPAIVQFDIRSIRGSNNLIVGVELSELVSALSLATLNPEKD